MRIRMAPGIRATVTFDGPSVCPVTELSAATETRVDSVATSICSDGCTECVTEFTVDADEVPDVDITPVFSHGSTHRYRLTHGGDPNCPCERLGVHGCPVSRYVAEDGSLTIVFHAADYDQLRSVVADLRKRFPGMDIERVVRSPDGEQPQDSVLVDRGKLTNRQLEVLEVADDMGYFERPRRTNATQIAAELDINPSTFREHLVAAESKILDDLL